MRSLFKQLPADALAVDRMHTTLVISDTCVGNACHTPFEPTAASTPIQRSSEAMQGTFVLVLGLVSKTNSKGARLPDAVLFLSDALLRGQKTHSIVQACSWIEECDVPGCAQSCVLNRLTMANAQTLNHRQYADGSWQMCPELAFWVNMTRPGEQRQSGSRKLQQVSATSFAR